MSRVILGLGASALAFSFLFTPAKAVEVYLFKGAGDFSFINENMHFSRGLERIRDELHKDGIHAVVRRHGETASALREIKRRKPKSVAFVGHSMGALASMSLAKRMQKLGIEVAYVGTLDIPGPIGRAGANVAKAENYYSITPVYGLLTNAGKHPDAKNIHVFGTHTTMDDSKKVFNGVVSAIREIHAAEQQELAPVDAPTMQEEPVFVQNETPNAVGGDKLLSDLSGEPSGEVALAARARPVSNLQTEETFAAVSPIPSGEDTLEPINLLTRPIGGASPQALERAGQSQNTVASLGQPSEPLPQRQVRAAQPEKAEVVDQSRTSRLLERVRSVLKRNGHRSERRARGQVDR